MEIQFEKALVVLSLMTAYLCMKSCLVFQSKPATQGVSCFKLFETILLRLAGFSHVLRWKQVGYWVNRQVSSCETTADKLTEKQTKATTRPGWYWGEDRERAGDCKADWGSGNGCVEWVGQTGWWEGPGGTGDKRGEVRGQITGKKIPRGGDMFTQK